MAKILVLDDQPEIARAIARMLPNHDTATETDPRRAIARVEHGEHFDLVLCDLQMPEMGGREVSEALCTAQLDAPPVVLMMSAGENVASLFEAGRAVLIKPFEAEELRQLVSAVLHEDTPRPHA